MPDTFLVLSGVSGCGKSYLTALLMQERGYAIIPSLTTRHPRSGESAIDRKFCSIEEFEKARREDRLLCARFFFGNWYAHDTQLIDRTIAGGPAVAQLSYKSLRTLRQRYPKVRIVYISPCPLERALDSILARKLSREEANERITEVHHEIDAAAKERPKPERCFESWFDNDFSTESANAFLSLVDRLMK